MPEASIPESEKPLAVLMTAFMDEFNRAMKVTGFSQPEMVAIAVAQTKNTVSLLFSPSEIGLAGRPPLFGSTVELFIGAMQGQHPRVVIEADVKQYTTKFNQAQSYIGDFLNAVSYIIEANRQKSLMSISGFSKLRQLYERGFPGKKRA